MRKKTIDYLISEYKNNNRIDVIEELTRRIIFGKLNEEQMRKLYFELTDMPIKQAVIRYSSRETLINLLIEEEYITIRDYIIKKLGNLNSQEAKILLTNDGIDLTTRNFAIRYADAITLIEYLKRNGSKIYQPSIFIDRFKVLNINTETADTLLSCTDSMMINDFAIEKASNMALIKFLYEKRELSCGNPTRIYHILMTSDLTNEEAKFIIDNIENESLICYAIKFASKDDVLSFYLKQTNMGIIEVCLTRLEELMKE